MARSTALRRGWEGGPPSALGIALRVLLIVGVFKLVALAAGGAYFFFPWLLVPLVFLLVGGGLFRGWHGGHGWGHRHGYEDLPPGGDARARPLAADEPADAAREREYRLEAELATAHRQIRELQEQLSWQGRLLKSAGAPPAGGTPPATGPGDAPAPATDALTPSAPSALPPAPPRQAPPAGPEPA